MKWIRDKGSSNSLFLPCVSSLRRNIPSLLGGFLRSLWRLLKTGKGKCVREESYANVERARRQGLLGVRKMFSCPKKGFKSGEGRLSGVLLGAGRVGYKSEAGDLSVECRRQPRAGEAWSEVLKWARVGKGYCSEG